MKGDFYGIIPTPLLVRDVLCPYKEVSLPFPQLASCVSTAFVAKVLPVNMTFSFSLIGMCVGGRGGGGGQ